MHTGRALRDSVRQVRKRRLSGSILLCAFALAGCTGGSAGSIRETTIDSKHMAELKEQVHSSPELTADEKVLILRCLPQSESPAESTAVHMGQTCGQLIDMKARAIKEREQMTLESVGADRAARGDPLHKALAVTIVGKTMEEDPENPNGFGQVTVRVKCENLTGREIKQFHGLIHCLFPDGYVETVSVQADKPLPAHKASVQTIVLRGSEIDLPYRFARADLSQGTTFWYPWAVVFPDKTSLSRQASDP